MKPLLILMVCLGSSFIIFAQPEKGKTTADTSLPGKNQVVYSCPMHPDVTSDKPGKCPKCNMDMTRSAKEKMKMKVMKMYTCPMHPDVVSKNPGNCTKCDMKLVEKREAPSKKKQKTVS